jgi:AraC family transcriptional regulator
MQPIAVTTVQPTLIPPLSNISGPAQYKFAGASAALHGNPLAEKGADNGDTLSIAGLRRVVEELCKALSSSLQDEHESAEASLQRANAILRFSAPNAISSGPPDKTAELPIEPIRGGLAPWRIRRVANHIEMNLDTTVRTKDLAALVELSSFHFCRAFRDSFGDSPHAYITRRRVERAQGFMLTTNTSLSQIAIDCGLADQSHFNRLFRQFVGESPGAWRRARTPVLQNADVPRFIGQTCRESAVRTT